jgi:hypothetical protein
VPSKAKQWHSVTQTEMSYIIYQGFQLIQEWKGDERYSKVTLEETMKVQKGVEV